MLPTIPVASIHKYRQRTKWLSFFFVIYFSFNSLFLPHGLLYTTTLAPLFYLWVLKMGGRLVLSKFMLLAIPIAICQLLVNTEINLFYFVRSFVLYLLVYVSAYSFGLLCKRIRSEDLERLFVKLIRLNFAFAILAMSIKWTPFADLLWTSTSFDSTQRLKLLTYEPSYYSTMMVPLAVFTIYRFIFRIGRRYISNLLLVLFPLMLSLSFGVISSLVLALGLTVFIKSRELLRNRLVIVMLVVFIAATVTIVSTDNPLASRLSDVVSGRDSSGAVRFFQSNYVAWKIAEKTSFVVGSGFGQSKELAIAFFDEFWFGLDVNRLTNVVAAMFAEFGLVGIGLRFFLELYLFFRTNVARSQYRTTLFLFAFIYQFTGSYITNLAEYIIWVLAFIPVFIEFENEKKSRKKPFLLGIDRGGTCR